MHECMTRLGTSERASIPSKTHVVSISYLALSMNRGEIIGLFTTTFNFLKAGFHKRRSHRWSRKITYDLVKTKIGVVSGVISSTESESEESDRGGCLFTELGFPVGFRVGFSSWIF